MEENTRRCTGACMECNPYQRGFCAAQLAYNNMKQLEYLSMEVKSLNEKIEAMQSNEASIFDPNVSENEDVVADSQQTEQSESKRRDRTNIRKDTAQEGSGARE